MRKPLIKTLTILTLSVAFASVCTTTTHALYIDEDDATWYTVPEMLEYKDLIDQEGQKLCGEDINCRQKLFFSKIETDEKFRALEQLTEQQIVVTSINPTNETLKVLFFDEEMMLKHMGISEKIELDEFYMGWFSNDVHRIYNYGSYVEELFANVLPGAHYIYAQFDNYGDKIPANQEVEIFAPGSNLNLNTSGEIAYGAFADNFNAVGRFIYTSCLTEPDYVEGAECRLMLSGEKGFRYFPPRETLVNSESTDHSEIEDSLPDNNEIDSENNIEIGSSNINDLLNQEGNQLAEDTSGVNPTLDINTIQTSPIQTDTNQTGNNLVKDTVSDNFSGDNSLQEATNKEPEFIVARPKSSPKVPETGASTSSEGDIIELPWWLKAIIALNVAILLWLFWPSHKKPSKTSKKVKKVVDKKYHLR